MALSPSKQENNFADFMSTVLSPTSTRIKICSTSDWLILAVLLAAAVGVMYDTWYDIFRVAIIDEELSYVLLAPFLVFYLAWSRRRLFRGCRIRNTWVGLPVVGFGWLVHWYGFNFDPAIWRAGAVVVAGGIVIATMGTDVAWRLGPALVAMAFLIPIDPTGRYRIAEPLEVFTAEAAQNVCVVLGMNVDRQGNLLSINGTAVTIAEACNGARMIVSLFMVCYFVAFDSPLKWYVRAALLLASPLVAIVANVTRLVPTIWMFGHASQTAAERFHDWSGWFMLLAAFGFLMGMTRLLLMALGQAPTNARVGAREALP